MAQLMSQVVGHQTNKDWLVSQAEKGELPSSMIFQGPHGVGKKFLALALLQQMNCQKSETACGACSDCVRVLEDKNEMIYHLHPEGKKTIGVDQVREAHHFLNLRSVKPARMVIIDPADKLTTSAANSLLKVLEEAPQGTYFILLTDKMRSLLPTIRSRSHILKFNHLTREELKQYRDFGALALDWSAGQLQMAIELDEESKSEQLNDSLHFLYGLLCEGPQDWKKRAAWFFNDDNLRDFSFNIWNQALAKRLHKEGENLDWIPEHSGTIADLHESLQGLQSDINANVDKLLAIENFYYRVHSLEPRS